MSDTGGDLPKSFDDLDIKWTLGSSGEATKYRATDKKLGRDVVVIVGREVSGEGLEHPNIRQIHRNGTVGGKPYSVLELVEGENLEVLREGHRISERRAVEVLERTARALDYAHNHGHVHPDLTADQIQVDKMDNPKVSGFRARRDGDDPREDIRSLGKVLKAHLSKDSNVDILDIANRCLDENPEVRYATAHDLSEDLTAWLEGKHISGLHVSVAERLAKRLKRNRVLFAALGGFIVVVVSVALYMKGRDEDPGVPDKDPAVVRKEEQAAEILSRVRKQMRDRERIVETLDLLQEAIDLAPTADAWSLRAEVNLLRDKTDMARRDLEEALRLAPGYGPAKRLKMKLRARDLLAEARGAEDERAIELLNEAIELYRYDALLFLERGRRLGKREKYGEAVRDLNEALRLDSRLAEARILKDGFREKLAEARKPKKKKPPRDQTELADFRLKLIESLEKKTWSDLVTLAEEGIERGPDRPWMHFFLAHGLLGAKSPQKALPHITAAIKENPEDADWIELRGDVHLEMGEARKAVDDYESAYGSSVKKINARLRELRSSAASTGDDAVLQIKTGAFFFMKRNYSPANGYFAKAVQLGDKRAHFWRALAFQGDGELDKAREEIETFLKTHPLEDAKAFLTRLK